MLVVQKVLWSMTLLIKYLEFKLKELIYQIRIKNCKPEVEKYLAVANAKNLPFEDNEFDYTISINTIHNLEIDECKEAIKEIERVSKISSFITVDAFNTDEEEKRMYEWNLTAKTIMSVTEWKKMFAELNYSGDYYWFIP